MKSSSGIRKKAAYFIQAILIIGWWLGLATNDSYFALFQFPGIESVAFKAFLAPDILVIAAISLARAFKPIQALEWIVLGAFAYAALYCINASVLTGGGFLSTVLMIIGLSYNLALCFFLRNAASCRELTTSTKRM